MDRDCFKLLLIIILIIQTCFTSLIKAEIDEDSWMDPDAWARDYLISGSLHTTNDKCCKCLEDDQSNPKEPLTNQQQSFREDLASSIYFKKFITILFNRKNFKYDPTLQIYERSIVFSIESGVMHKLEQLQDPRDLDHILTEILNNARSPNTYRDGQQQLYTTEASNVFKTIILNLLQLTKTSEIRFFLVVAIVVLIAWIFSTRFNIGWLPLVFGGIFIYGYFHTYLECNRELEVNQMLEILNLDKESKQSAEGSKFLNFFKELFYSSDVQGTQKQKIKQSAKLSLGFCRPDHVLIMYCNDIFLKYLQLLIEQCTNTLTTINLALGFPYNILSGFLLVSMIGYIIKLTFKYIISPSAWAHFIYRKQLYQSEQVTIKNTMNSEGDRISGDNLKLLLNAISLAPQRAAVDSKLSTATTVSGVEDVQEAIEPNKENISPQLHESDASKTNNNDSSVNPLDKKYDNNEEKLLLFFEKS